METKIAMSTGWHGLVAVVVKGQNGPTGLAENAADHRHERPQWTDMMRQN
ncbi:hypothetical protein PMI06_008346 [Burkholderia sp. BT03]|nr:hypothetical protein PMI06_008346 [Burkholderia sp. BT03]SKC74376.1 hypothetical protein SAMN06266956_2651 [Paraburkholderia hospita]